MTKIDSNPSSPVNESLAAYSPASSVLSLTAAQDTEHAHTEFIVDDAELLSILALSNDQQQNHAENTFETPVVAILDWEDWNQEVPEFVNNKRKRNDDDLADSDDDEEDEFNFLDQFDFVDASFDHPPLSESNKKQKTNTTTNNNNTSFVDESADDLSTLLKKSDSLMAELDSGWVLDIIS